MDKIKHEKKGLDSIKKAIKDFVYGMAAHDMVTYSLKTWKRTLLRDRDVTDRMFGG